ncbi:TIGR02281 family clan AA aspartic protease [Oceanimonas sp. MB9]|uniref:retropepsin-like aspartic protease family protein n=1 Tax=Oceanimonas sp. MB9 TaxID=2588453 RepID=UPI0013F673C7|nr:retropepsin-like aspartic protease [Oceanimonas sp. MB9]NHH99819.1 hypothetical protein [Oceanimonas sp. MB9]
MTQPRDPVRRTGRIMWLLAWLLALMLLTWHFHQRLMLRANTERQVQVVGSDSVVLQQSRHGHYLADGAINGQPVVLLLDTGATQMAVPQAVAARLTLPVGAPLRLSTAAGHVTGYRTRIKTLSLGPFTLYDLDAVIMPGTSDEVLLGMNALRRFELTQRGSQLTMKFLQQAP